ncbi:MAG: DNA-3-methyladenine glycosylase 2 family protein [Kiritimatiellaeota bacterium]|nr:DNA-3-methyladenine glycosylase 2 family protein [Kiritimatiellota bacterium]
MKDARPYLRERDSVLATILTGPDWKLPRSADLYRALLDAIVSQQLSGRAAATIFERFLDLFPDREPTPRRLQAMSLPRLRSAGISRQKAGYLKNVAAFALRQPLDRATLRRMSDDKIIAQLTTIKGVGRWTVEMLLMFSLGRRDVFPLDDLGIQLAMKKLYRLRGHGRQLHKRMLAIASRWQPERSLACRYLWCWRSQNK